MAHVVVKGSDSDPALRKPKEIAQPERATDQRGKTLTESKAAKVTQAMRTANNKIALFRKL